MANKFGAEDFSGLPNVIGWFYNEFFLRHGEVCYVVVVNFLSNLVVFFFNLLPWALNYLTPCTRQNLLTFETFFSNFSQLKQLVAMISLSGATLYETFASYFQLDALVSS